MNCIYNCKKREAGYLFEKVPPPYYQPFSCPWAWNVQLLQRGCIVANSSDCACFRQWPDIIVHNPLCPPGATQIRWGSHVNRNHFRRRAASSFLATRSYVFYFILFLDFFLCKKCLRFFVSIHCCGPLHCMMKQNCLNKAKSILFNYQYWLNYF